MSKAMVKSQQRDWAQRAGIPLEHEFYTVNLADNLFLKALSPASNRAFASGGGGELRSRKASKSGASVPEKLRALHSSAALAVNVFDYWTAQPSRRPLWEALGIAGAVDFSFEREFSTGLGGTPPTLDVAIECPAASRRFVGVESKFTEWLDAPSEGAPFKPVYLEEGANRWAQRRLPACQALAAELQENPRLYSRLHAAQLLKHLLGLSQQQGVGKVALIYLYYDVPGRESDEHRADLSAFAARVREEVDFRVVTYQELIAALQVACGDQHKAYIEYLTARYAGAAGEREAKPH